MASTAIHVTAPNGDYILCGTSTDDVASVLKDNHGTAKSWLSLSACHDLLPQTAIEAAGMQYAFVPVVVSGRLDERGQGWRGGGVGVVIVPR